jgi:hypothetical protein
VNLSGCGYGPVAWFCEQDDELVGYIKCWEYLEYLRENFATQEAVTSIELTALQYEQFLKFFCVLFARLVWFTMSVSSFRDQRDAFVRGWEAQTLAIRLGG